MGSSTNPTAIGRTAAASVFLAALAAASFPGQDAPLAPNVLLVLLDDVGIDRIRAYDRHRRPGRTPNIDALAEHGMLFRNVWANPWCSPTRATILTGRYSFRTGMGDGATRSGWRYDLPASERTLPEALPEAYRSGVFGKWHLSGSPTNTDHPLASGFDVFAGSVGNIGDYASWLRVADGEVERCTVYATTAATDDLLAFLDAASEPWFAFLAYHAAHAPFHFPPDELHGYGRRQEGEEDRTVFQMRAMVQALDTELGRVLERIDRERTYVILASDNGTPPQATTLPFNSQLAKGTLGQAGIHVPLIVAGPGVERGECHALVNTTDLYATVLELAGGASRAEDSVSLVPYFTDPQRASLRTLQFAELFQPNGFGAPRRWERAVSDGRYKLVHRLPAETWELYDLESDPHDRRELLAREPSLEQERAAGRLRAELERLLATRVEPESQDDPDD